MTATPKYGVRVYGKAVRPTGRVVGFVDGHATKRPLDTLRRIANWDLGVTVAWHRQRDESDPALQQECQLPRDP